MRAFITGASSGIGAALAANYAGDGATLGLVARSLAPLERVAEPLRRQGATVHLYSVDVADTARMTDAIGRFIAAAGGADLVVANAGVSLSGLGSGSDSERVGRLMLTNVVGVTNTVLPFVPAMVEQQSGTLAAIASVAGVRALPGSAAYCASKAAVSTFMDGLRMDLYDTGVHVVTICPGFVRTRMVAASTHPKPFMLEPHEAARAIAHAIEARKTTYLFPWQMRALEALLRRLPERLVRVAMAATSPPAAPSGRRPATSASACARSPDATASRPGRRDA